jgi:hypothetical protein
MQYALYTLKVGDGSSFFVRRSIKLGEAPEIWVRHFGYLKLDKISMAY